MIILYKFVMTRFYQDFTRKNNQENPYSYKKRYENLFSVEKKKKLKGEKKKSCEEEKKPGKVEKYFE